jgi:hypothetical protein
MARSTTGAESFRQNTVATSAGSRQALTGLSSTVTPQKSLLAGYYSVKTLGIDLTNADGDSVSLSATSIDYQKAIAAANESDSDETWKKIIDDIKDEYIRMKGAIVEKVFGGGDEAKAAADPRSFDEAKEIPGLPEYWNAENTAGRIADFALSFAGMFEGGDDEFVSMIKDAIDKGFSQAKDLLGKMPGEITKLTDKTHALIMDKIDKWASDRAAGAENAVEQPAASIYGG